MASLTVSVQRSDHLADFPSALTELGQQYMSLAVNIAQGAVQRNAPVNLGTFRNSIANSVVVSGLTITGQVFSQDDVVKVAVIEEGRKPGRFPPVGAITRWVQLVIRPPANQLRQISYLIGRAIAQRGIAAKHVFARSYSEVEGEVQRILGEEFPAALAKRL